MRPSFLKSYFTFSKKERQGIAVLLILLTGLFLVPCLLPYPPETETTDFSAFQQAVKEWQQPPPGQGPVTDLQERRAGNTRSSYPDSLFYFDPNTLPAGGWTLLGLEGRTIRTIQHYLAKGGRFYKKEDLRKIYGLRQEEYERLTPYIQIKSSKGYRELQAKDTPGAFTAPFIQKISPGKERPSFSDIIIEINTADTTRLIRLRGIGSKLAQRIVKFRNKLGGFSEVEQIREVYGLPDSTFFQIKPYLTVDPSLLRKININTVEVNSLKQHPYFNYNLANTIVQYRRQHGLFGRVEEVKNLALVEEEIYRKIAPYLTVE